jgi:hypothetical protein
LIDLSVAIGGSSKANASRSITIGSSSQANNRYSVALGSYSLSSSLCNTALDGYARANFQNSIAIGYNVTIEEINSAKIGNSDIKKVYLGDLIITWTSSSVKFQLGSNSATLTLSTS